MIPLGYGDEMEFIITMIYFKYTALYPAFLRRDK